MRFGSDSQRRAAFANMFSRAGNVSRGGRFEQKIRSRLDNSNCVVAIRSSGSRSLWDVVCITPDKVRIIQAKTHGYLTPSERERMFSDMQRMPDNVQAEFEYYTSPRVRTNRTLKKAGETDWDKVKERLDHFGKVRGYRKSGGDSEFARESRVISEERKADITGGINTEIERRVEYGSRNELIPKGNKTLLTWSNAASDWLVGTHTRSYLRDMGNPPDIRLDANQIIVPYSAGEVEAVKGRLMPLPLSGLSHEVTSKLDPVEQLESKIEWGALREEKVNKERWQEENK